MPMSLGIPLVKSWRICCRLIVEAYVLECCSRCLFCVGVWQNDFVPCCWYYRISHFCSCKGSVVDWLLGCSLCPGMLLNDNFLISCTATDVSSAKSWCLPEWGFRIFRRKLLWDWNLLESQTWKTFRLHIPEGSGRQLKPIIPILVRTTRWQKDGVGASSVMLLEAALSVRFFFLIKRLMNRCR